MSNLNESKERRNCRKLLEERGFKRGENTWEGYADYVKDNVRVSVCGCGSWAVFATRKTRPPEGKDWERRHKGWVTSGFDDAELMDCLDGLKPRRGVAHV